MPFYTAFTDGEQGASATINYRLAEMEAAITARTGAMIERAQVTLAADAASITIDITVGDNTLMLVTALRTNRAAANDAVYATINDDLVTSYVTRYLLVDSGAASSVGATSTSGFTLDYAAAGATAPANAYSAMILRVPMASASVVKPCAYDITQADSVGAVPRLVSGSALYAPTIATAVTRLKLTPVNGTVFTAGSSYTLYGLS